MYFYLLDTFLQQKKYEREIARIETRITDLGIGGQVARLNILKDINELVQDAIKRGINTVVVIGDDQTIGKVVDVVARHDVVLGIIPVGEQLNMAKLLGIPKGEAACEILSRRITEQLDLGVANDFYFLSSLETSNTDVVLESDKGYRIIPLPNAERVAITNLALWEPTSERKNAFKPHPQDGVVEVVVMGKKKAQKFSLMKKRKPWLVSPHDHEDVSMAPISKISIEAAPGAALTATLDGKRVIKPPIEITVAPKKLKIIVGKSRDI